MAQEYALIVLFGIGYEEGNRFAGRIQFGLGGSVFFAHDSVGGAALAVRYLFGLKLVCVSLTRRRIELPARGSRRMAGPIAEGHYGEDQQRGDLDDVDG